MNYSNHCLTNPLTTLLVVSVLIFHSASCYIFTKSDTSKDKRTSDKKIEQFDTFYQKFNRNSNFQLSRISFPDKKINNIPIIQGQHKDMENQYSWNSQNWIVHKAKIDDVDTKLFDLKTTKTDTYHKEVISAKDGTLEFSRTFKLIHNQWFLVECTDISH